MSTQEIITAEEFKTLISVIKNSDKYASAGFNIEVSFVSPYAGKEVPVPTIQITDMGAKISKRQKGYWNKVKKIAEKQNISIAQARKILSAEKKERKSA